MKNFFLIAWLLCISQVDALSDVHQKMIEDLVQKNPKQLTVAEYTAIAETVAQRTPCNMLVFGVGRDSALWMDLNKKGHTVFLEDNLRWLNFSKNTVPGINVHLVRYGTKRRHWEKMLNNPDRMSLLLALPQEVRAAQWDLIFVDGPKGSTPKTPGRMKSIFTASLLACANNNVDVFVHDCDRPVERVYTDTFLLPSNLKNTITKLRHYHIKK